ncbi:MAG: helix-turn-helix transcriptional regulator [Bacteroidales bacterium]|jgi:AraC family cel operon transcriptional repressor|nr:helix-turn-helix transcriptional regulator [Bacteroidales bacterium]
MEHYELDEFLSYGQEFHLVHREISPSVVAHDHDYFEVFWVTDGDGYQIVNDQRMPLIKQDIIFMRPADMHSIYCGSDGLTIINLSFSQQTGNFYHERYFKNKNVLFWSRTSLPVKKHLDLDFMKLLTDMAHDIMGNPPDYLQLDSLFITLFKNMSKIQSNTPLVVPAWLNHAIKMYQTPAQFKQGSESFIDACRRNPSYVNRVIKKYFHETMTQMLNEKKMRYAAIQLSQLNTPIKRICSDCGFDNMGHFFRVFKKIYGLTPNKYRLRHQHLI